MKPLTDERPLLFRPTLAKALGERYGKPHGANLAIVLERAHVCQQTRGLPPEWVSIGGRQAELVLFRWSLEDQERDFPFLSRSSIQRVLRILTAGRQSQPSLDSADLLWKVRVRAAGRVCEDRYSVNYAAVPEVTKLHRAAAVDPPPATAPPRSGRPTTAVNVTSARGQDDLIFGQDDQTSLEKESGEACMHAGGESGQDDAGAAAAAAALVVFGRGDIDPGAAADLVARWADGPARARVACDNVGRLAAAGFKFDASPVGYAVSLMKKNRARLSDEEVARRVAWQRANRTKPGPAGSVAFNVAPDAEVAARLAACRLHDRQEAALDALGEQRWAELADQARAGWAQYRPNQPFPANSRKNATVRAIVKALLFRDQPKGVQA